MYCFHNGKCVYITLFSVIYYTIGHLMIFIKDFHTVFVTLFLICVFQTETPTKEWRLRSSGLARVCPEPTCLCLQISCPISECFLSMFL